ncbi:MAG: C25 family cysteine peptidase [Salibacteraceae bacterium]
MKRLLLVIILLITQASLFSQSFGNEWINFNQRYLKVPVSKKGIYQINHIELASAFNSIGVNISNVDPRNIQIFNRGHEQFIHIEGESDGIFDSTDYVVFYGVENDGWLDKQLYIDSNIEQLNPYYSLFNDTSWYFITVNNSLSNKRYKVNSNNNFTNKTSKQYVSSESVYWQNTVYSEGVKDGAGLSSALYQKGEGYGGYAIQSGSVRSFEVKCPNQSLTGPDALVETRTIGYSNAVGAPNHGLIIEYGSNPRTTVVDTTYSGYEMITHNFSIPAASLTSAPRIYYSKKPLTPEPPSDYQMPSFAKINYSHSMALNGESLVRFNIEQDTDTSYYHFNGASGTYFSKALDYSSGMLYSIIQTGSDIEFNANPGQKRELVITNNVNQVQGIKAVYNKNSGPGHMTNYASLVADSSFVIVSHPKIWSGAQQYLAYSNSKGLNAVLFDINELYEQFSHGIYKHPLAIRNLMRYLTAKSTVPPAYLFIIGKSVKETDTRKNFTYRERSLVPTMGYPPADNLFTTPNDNINFTPVSATGRLAASTNQQVIDYLNKVKSLDDENRLNSPNIEDKYWTKRGIHFAGGSDEAQQNVFANYLNRYGAIWENVLLGGSIKTFKRFSSGAVQEIQFDSVKYFIDNGVSLLSFFGHGSGGQLGINIGEPSDYSNTGKYPLFIANSCNVGDYHLPNDNAVTVNEKWILEPNAGAIGFIASTAASYPYPLNSWSESFYANLSKNRYFSSIGESMIQTISEISGPNSQINKACLEMNLHGDPSLKLYPKEKPDFAIRTTDLSVPNFISIDKRSVEINYTIHNIGQGIDTLVPIRIKRTYPSGNDTLYLDTIAGITNTYNGSFLVFIGTDKSVGENKFSISIDPDNTIDEIYPLINNATGTVKLNVTSDDLIPVHPGNYSIQPNSEIILSASTADPKAPARSYQFEIDRIQDFSSPNKKSKVINGQGGSIQWQPNLTTVNDSDVFYWRCSAIDNSGNFKWRTRSFQFINGKTGWSQYEFEQFEENTFQNLTYDKTNKTIDFADTKNNIAAYNQGLPQVLIDYYAIRMSINGAQLGRLGACRGARSMLIAVINPTTMEAWQTRYEDNGVIINPDKNFGNYNDYTKGACAVPDNRFQFLVSDSVMMDSMIYMITQAVPDSFYIMAMSGVSGNFQDSTAWKNRHYQLFEDLGADSIRHIPNDHPYILIAQKGNKNKAIEVIGSHSRASISASVFVDSKTNTGTINSVTIPLSDDYKSLYWNYSINNPEDSIELILSGEEVNGNTIELLRINDNSFNIDDLKVKIPNINYYKNLQLTANVSDLQTNVAPQLDYWYMLSDEALELALHPVGHLKFHNDTLTQGENLEFEMSVLNLSSAKSDSILVSYLLLDRSNNTVQRELVKTSPFQAYDSTVISYSFKTDNLSGDYILLVDINPEDTLWQTEIEHFNNIMPFSFYVAGDNTNPLLDVTFDGKHILDGDLISARPEIKAQLNDENLFLPLNDTSFFIVNLTYPNKAQKRLYFNSNSGEYVMDFEAGDDQENEATIYLNPILVEDGTYQLDIDAKDASGNRSGKNKYSIQFEIENKSTITEILNYPNPFSTSTRFVFSLTGYQVPDYFRIQILTATGRVVREIDRDELGVITIGRNITDYAWDGKDEFGDQLANGVYFYRVITKIEGEEIEHKSTNADNYFKKGFGKMYLMR